MLNKKVKETEKETQKRAVIYFYGSFNYFNSESFEEEKEECIKVAKLLNYELVNIYIDLTGQKKASFQSLIRDMQHNAFDDIILYSITRVDYNINEIFHFYKEVEKNGIGIKSVKDQGTKVFSSEYINERKHMERIERLCLVMNASLAIAMYLDCNSSSRNEL
ncbi:hypothetical protein A5819_000946 [Enterococcus sp. 7E2_DIV0204]|uniref:recombinase family protein n=1 Tax=unclassified Enterococcus TaxID=2608891 RepID=UPI000A32BEC9|nr:MULTISPECIES: recombinase family protein [unclassified Enterococcus]OTN88465.1 hypothetical protein A5819_000946 [Enterococcus sp. 7E2_DIV0204]OTP50934.1 hypothetical protein A5884_000120 [Enterococcus sp. 7D2_DIV0200]